MKFLTNKILSKAFEFMVVAHKGQLYGDMPYFTHPVAVAEGLKNPTDDEYISALLHDVVEDTDISLEEIEKTFGAEVSATVALLTKDNSLSYEENITRIISSGNVGAIKVKLSDNTVNMNGDKSQMNPERKAKLDSRYSKSFVRLTAATS